MNFKGLDIHIDRFHSQSRTRTGRGGRLIRETKIPVQKFWLKMGGGIFAGHYGNEHTVLSTKIGRAFEQWHL